MSDCNLYIGFSPLLLVIDQVEPSLPIFFSEKKLTKVKWENPKEDNAVFVRFRMKN